MLPETKDDESTPLSPRVNPTSGVAPSGARDRVTPPPRKPKAPSEPSPGPVSQLPNLMGFFGVQLQPEAPTPKHSKALPAPPPRPSTSRRSAPLPPSARRVSERPSLDRISGEQSALPEAPPNVHASRATLKGSPPPKPGAPSHGRPPPPKPRASLAPTAERQPTAATRQAPPKPVEAHKRAVTTKTPPRPSVPPLG
jgi:hypothetical protein